MPGRKYWEGGAMAKWFFQNSQKQEEGLPHALFPWLTYIFYLNFFGLNLNIAVVAFQFSTSWGGFAFLQLGGDCNFREQTLTFYQLSMHFWHDFISIKWVEFRPTWGDNNVPRAFRDRESYHNSFRRSMLKPPFPSGRAFSPPLFRLLWLPGDAPESPQKSKQAWFSASHCSLLFFTSWSPCYPGTRSSLYLKIKTQWHQDGIKK